MTLADFLRSGGGPTQDDPTGAAALAFVKQYDPNASLGMQSVEQGGGESGGSLSTPTVVLNYDASKLPQPKAGYVPDLFLDANGKSVGGPGQGGFTPRDNYTTANKIYDPTTGLWEIPTGDQGTIDEKMNNAQQNASGGLFSQIGNAIVPSNKPWMAVVNAIMAGAAPAVGNALGGGTLGSLGSNALKFGVNALTSGGANLTNPMSYLGFAGGVPGLSDILPYLKAGQAVYGASQGKNLPGNAMTLGQFASNYGGGNG